MVGQHRRHFWSGKRYMQEEADPIFVTQLAELSTQWDEMIVVNPDDIIGPRGFAKAGRRNEL